MKEMSRLKQAPCFQEGGVPGRGVQQVRALHQLRTQWVALPDTRDSVWGLGIRILLALCVTILNPKIQISPFSDNDVLSGARNQRTSRM